MGAAFVEVLHDLWLFALGRDAQPTVSYRPTPRPDSADVVRSTPPSPTLDLVVPAISPDMVEGRSAYIAWEEVACLSRPALDFDTVLGTLSYADRVAVDVIEGEFAHVISPTVAGWVPVGALTEDQQSVLPYFLDGQRYQNDSPETKKLRTFIKDEALGAVLQLPLQGTEYIMYRLRRAGVTVRWSDVRPRTPGSWQRLLRGQSGVTMSIEPKTGAVLEYTGSEAPSFLGYVESVKPDRSIVLTSVGRDADGQFREETLSADEWREWRPVFISFT